MIPAYRPHEAAPPPEPYYEPREKVRRQKWVDRERRKGNTDARIEDAPPRRTRDDWVTPCRSCGGAGDNWDLEADWRNGEARLVRFCRPCRTLSDCAFEGCENTRARRSRYCYGHEKQEKRGQELRPLGRWQRGVVPCEVCGRDTLPGQRSGGKCGRCRMREARRAS